MMFSVLTQLENDTEIILSIARKQLFQLATLNYQEQDDIDYTNKKLLEKYKKKYDIICLEYV